MASIDKKPRSATGRVRVRWRTINGHDRARTVASRSLAAALKREIEAAHSMGRDWHGDVTHARDDKSRTVRALRGLVAELRDKGAVERVSSAEVPPALNRVGHRLRHVPIVVTPPGVYFLLDGEEIVYVGQSVNPCGRILQHLGDKHFTRAFTLPVPARILDAAEGALIRHLRPRLNGNAGPIFPEDAAILRSIGLLVDNEPTVAIE
jgi:hypothetical protein